MTFWQQTSLKVYTEITTMLDHSTQVQPPESTHNGRKTPKIVEKHLIRV